MAVARSRITDIPKDAVILSIDEALEYHTKIISNWHTPGDVWILNYGSGFLGILAGVTGIYINDHYRKRMRLGSYGYVSSYIPIIFLPAIMATLFHKTIVQPRILLHQNECSVCVQTQAMAIQSFFGIVYPCILAPVASYHFALRNCTYRVPSFINNPKEFLKWHRKTTSPLMLGLSIAFGIHIIGTSLLTYKETDQFAKVLQELDQIEENLASGMPVTTVKR